MTAELVDAVLAGSRRALARLLTRIENGEPGTQEALADLFPHTGHATVIGITGAPGTGKSTLVNALAGAFRAEDRTVGIIAVDPTSPFSGGAILGDRIRMQDRSGDPGVFIRSMATRGSLGGLARAVWDAIRVMDAAGFDVILVETVGAGQSEVDIVRVAHTTVVVEAPGLGDDVQAIKAGILEIADVLVVNKADRGGASSTVRALKAMLELGHPLARSRLMGQYEAAHHLAASPVAADIPDATWVPPLIQTIATSEDSGKSGITELVHAIASHKRFLVDSGLMAVLEAQRIQLEVYERLQSELMRRFIHALPAERVQTVVMQVRARTLDPQQAVFALLDTVGEGN
jgi:LAO/AO transport system kinase